MQGSRYRHVVFLNRCSVVKSDVHLEFCDTTDIVFAKTFAWSISSWEASSRGSVVRPLMPIFFRWAGRRAVELTLFVDAFTILTVLCGISAEFEEAFNLTSTGKTDWMSWRRPRNVRRFRTKSCRVVFWILISILLDFPPPPLPRADFV